MELNALDFVSKYKDLITDGVVVDPVLDKAQSLFLNKMVVHRGSTVGLIGTAHSFSLFGPSDAFKKTLTLLSLISEEAPVAIKPDCFPLIKELTGLTAINESDEAWHYIFALLGGATLEVKGWNRYPLSDNNLRLCLTRKMPPLLKSHEPKMFYDLWDELEKERFCHCGDMLLELFFTTTPFYFLDYEDVRGVNINITRRG